MQIEMNAVHFKADSKLQEFVKAKLQKLEQFSDRIIDAQVFLKLDTHDQIKEKVAEIRLKVPGDILFSKSSDRTFEAAVDAAVEGLRRSLKKYKARQRN